jgi:hypothetical protein
LYSLDHLHLNAFVDLDKTRKSRRNQICVFWMKLIERKRETSFIHYSFIYFIQLKNQRKRERENLLGVVEYEKKRD